MSGLTKGILGALVVGAAVLLASPQRAEARRWVYYYPGAVAAPVPAPVYSAYYPVYPGRAVYRSYYAPGYVVPAYTAPVPYMWYGY